MNYSKQDVENNAEKYLENNVQNTIKNHTASDLSSFVSQKFKFYAFLSMLLLVYVHGYNLNERYLQPFTFVQETLTFNTFIQYFLANGIFRFRIPMLFIISGFLYALHDEKPYKERTVKRLRTLLLPYLLWSGIGMLFVFSLEQFPYTLNLVKQTPFWPYPEKLIQEYNFDEFITKWIFAPLPFQLWFIRVLLIYNILYPAIRWAVMKGAKIYFPIMGLFWLSSIHLGFIEGEGLFFFSLGIWMQKRNFDIVESNKWLSPIFWGVIFIGFTTIKTYLAFFGLAILGENTYFPLMLILHKIVIFSGLIAVWFGCDVLVRFFMKQSWFVWMSAFSFMIYALHAPLINYALNATFPLVKEIPHYRLLTFILLPTTISLFCISVGAILRKVSPSVYGILTGGRGM
jgi:fucose 4-O-acetylase-like acetyltransferase